LRERYARLFEVRGVVMKALEDARNAKLIGSGLEAAVTISTNEETQAFLRSFGPSLPFLLIVSQVELRTADTVTVAVERAAGQKCERCWNYAVDVGVDTRYPGACGRCVGNLTEG
jgi:isoleucyl-tRNA synthetase